MTETEEEIVAAIDMAEEITDPFDELVAATQSDPGAPFTPEVLEMLRELRNNNQAAFETLRNKLKGAGCRVATLDEAMAEDGSNGGGRPKQADILIDLTKDIGLFHSPDRKAFADLEIDGHRETWPVRMREFKQWLAQRFYEAIESAPNSDTLQSALNIIEAKALCNGPTKDVYVRVAGHEGKLYLDLADDAWRAVEIDKYGWRFVEGPPVRFRRVSGMQALPEPVSGGSVNTLRSFLNVGNDDDFTLIVAWALAVLRDEGPYPIIVLSGEQGSAKSTFSNILRALLDPNTSPLRSLPRNDRDLFIAATNAHMQTFDNVSSMPGWLSDALCRIATGGGFAVRQLYSDQGETLFDATRPIMLNGIEDIVTRSDLADRAIFLTLQPIPEDRRRPEKELWADFEEERPKVLGALLDAVSMGLRVLPETKLESLPRMADFALWATACESGLWEEGSFLKAYAGNRDDAVENVIDADAVGSAVRTLMQTQTMWTGTATGLLEALSELVVEAVRKSKSWPSTAQTLSNRLKRASTFLRKVGIEIEYSKEGRRRTRTIHISSLAENLGERPSAPSASSANGQEAQYSRVSGADGVQANTVCANPAESLAADDADDADGELPTQTAGWRATI